MFTKMRARFAFWTLLGAVVTYATNATPEQIKAATALARACEVCFWPNLSPAESGQTSPE